MKKIMLVGRSGSGKTTLTQALKGQKITYHKTQYINRYDVVIDTPGEYIETKMLGGALALYAYEADLVGLLLSATEPFSLYNPNITSLVNREVIGIITQADRPGANPEMARRWLEIAGCRNIFIVNPETGEGIGELFTYLKEEGDLLPWEKQDKTKIKTTKNKENI
ncbi:MAG: EutP/PduV family microcompartment system protein [Lachnospiraceae bacterium]|nr:EutP/PduV family microcompartment system protein [Lachnospiraceae bacterium]MDD3659790.1 EutP/PduV family microcompartment system protein [Lachnospiraceae bacterium]